MPVYNAGQTLRGVLESIVGQSCKDLRIVISDNASNDDTEAICREFAGRDPRIVYVRQPANIGPAANFAFVLEKADTEYFIWAASDDIHSPDFIEENVRFLDNNPDFLGSTCPVRFEGGGYDPVAMGDETRDEPDRFERILKFFGVSHANGRFYSLFRTQAIKKATFGQLCLAGDWITVIDLLHSGKMKRLDRGFLELGRNGASNSLEAYSKFRSRMICWIIPFFDLSLHVSRLFRKAPFRQKLRLLAVLLHHNQAAFRWQIRCELRRTWLRFQKPKTLAIT